MIGDVIERVKQDMTGRMCDEDDNVRTNGHHLYSTEGQT